jgi:hypothetical protein
VGRVPASIVIDLDPDADPVAGRVSTDGLPPRVFTGWIGLFAALRAATGADGHEDVATGERAPVPEVGKLSIVVPDTLRTEPEPATPEDSR